LDALRPHARRDPPVILRRPEAKAVVLRRPKAKAVILRRPKADEGSRRA
jgi:hypothetical protein